YRILDLVDICDLSVMYRGGCERPDFTSYKGQWGKERILKLRQNIIQTPLIDISSTEIREKIASGADVTGMLDPQVAQYITENNLYKPLT
ncbi:nicotinate-nicotinamide nucleotide adenylyltransferase, partial [Planctomycetota bacterium]